MTQTDQANAAATLAPDAHHPRIDPTTVVGWGVDADPDNDPTWPIRDRSNDDGPGANWTPPEAQQSDIEILQSVEYQRRPAVFGLSSPPSGLSGTVRRSAFAFSESQWGHWVLLMLADRINTVEGVIQDVGNGRLTNPLVEMGLVPRSRSAQTAVATWAIGGAVLFTLLHLSRSRRQTD